MLLLVCGGFLEDFRNLHIAVLFRLGGKERVLIARHGFSCECGLQVCFGAGALEFCHNSYPFSTFPILPVSFDGQTVLTALLVFPASAANTLEQNFVPMQLHAGGILHAVDEIGDRRHKYIKNAAALGAPHMIMRLDVEIK